MNELLIPPGPNWYNDSVLSCTPENHVVYASRRDIVILYPAPVTKAAEIQIIHGAHADRVLSVNANVVTWGKPSRQLVSVGDDKFIKLWNFDTLTCEMQHNDHEKNASPIVCARFAGGRIVSVAENGLIIVWQLAADTKRCLNNIFGMKVKVMCMATCPHAVYLTAFGLASGLVVIADLRQSGKVLYKMREHDHDITSLSWCPVPYNIYKTKSGIEMMDSVKKKNKNISTIISPMERTVTSPIKELLEVQDIADDGFNEKCEELQKQLLEMKDEQISNIQETCDLLTDSKPVANDLSKKTSEQIDEFGESLGEIIYPVRDRPVVDKRNPWGNIKFNDSDEENPELIIPTEEIIEKVQPDDFLAECLLLRNKIVTNITESEHISHEPQNLKSDENLTVTEDIEKLQIDTEIIKAYSDNKIQTRKQCDKDVVQIDPEVIKVGCVLTHSEVDDKVEIDKHTITIEDTKSINSSDCSKADNDNKIDIEKPEYILDLSLYPDESKDFLLASVCRAGTICIWRAGSDGHLQIQLPKHTKSSHSHKKRDSRQNWISLNWAQPTLLLSSSIWHELLIWDLIPKPAKQMKFQIKSSLVHTDHQKYIFTIATPYKLFETPDQENWRSNKELCVWTTSQDRWLLCTNLSTRCNQASYSTFGGNITCMSISQLDPNRLAYAVGDGTIRIWDLSRPHKQNITNVSFYDKVHTKATCIDWHPTRENFLAFSTCEGRIGEYDLTSRSRSANIYSNYHRSTVYKLQWGPLPDDQNKYGIYSCSLGELIVHDASKPNKEPYQLAIFEDENVTNFAWKTDYTVLAVGSRNGSVKLLNPKFQLLQTLYMQKKSVRCLEWHPLATVCDTGLSEYSSYLAVSTKENDIFVYNCLNQHGDADTRVHHIVLKGHGGSVKCMSWCPQVSGRLVSSGDDGVTIVWNVKTQEMLSVFANLYDNSVSVVWSPLDADLIISGGKLLQIWRITKNPPILPKILKKHENKQKRLIKVVPMKTETNGKPASQKDATFLQDKDKKKSVLTLTSGMLFDTEITIKSCRKLLESLNVTDDIDVDETEGDTSEDSEEFEDAKEHSEINAETLLAPLKLFGSRKDVLTLLDHEQVHHLQKKKITNHGLVGLWKGNLNETINRAIELNEITPWIINMAPMVSHNDRLSNFLPCSEQLTELIPENNKTWLQLCEKYAHILCTKEDYLEASSYFLTCHKVEDAIDSLCKGHYFKEALTLAKIRLPEGSEIIQTILDNWLKYVIANGHYEIAAMLYIKMKKYLEAAEILNKRSDLETLKLAADLAEKTTNKDLLITINTKINESDINTSLADNKHDINICESRLQALLLHSNKDVEEKFDLGEDSNKGLKLPANDSLDVENNANARD